MTRKIENASTGIATATSQDRPRSVRSAMMMPPIMVIGAATNIVLLSSTSVCTC